MLKSGEEGISGIEQIREQTTRMLMHASLGQWDDGEEEALDLMAMRGGDDVQIARTVLAAEFACTAGHQGGRAETCSAPPSGHGYAPNAMVPLRAQA